MPDDPKLPPIVLRAMIAILATFLFVAIYSNVQRLRRNNIETIIVTPIPTPTPSDSSTPAQQ